MLQTETATLTGGFEADEMGLGKTIIALASVVVARQVIRMWRAVRESWEKKDGKHLPRECTDATQCCPSESFTGLCCPCEYMGPMQQIEPAEGLQLLMVPSKLMVHWAKEWKDAIDEDKVDVQLRIGLGRRRLLELQPLKMVFMEDVGVDKIRNYRYKEAEDWGFAQGWKRYQREEGGAIDPEHQKYLDAKRSQPPSARTGQSRIVILTTPQSFQKHVEDRLAVHFKQDRPTGTGPKGGPKKARPAFTYTERDTVIWSRVLRDECHEEKTPTTCSLRILRRLRGPHTIRAKSRGGQGRIAQTPPTWFLSGTPFEISPGDLHGYLEVLERSHWPDTANLQDCTSVAMTELGQRFRRAGRLSTTDLTAMIEEFHARLRALPFLRRVLSSEWNGQVIVTLPPHSTVDVDCEIHADFQKQLERLEASVGCELSGASAQQSTTVSPQFRSSLQRLRVLLSFPNLCMFYKDHPDLPLTIKDLCKKGWDRNPESSWFAENIEAVVHHSTKFEEICRIIRGLGNDHAGRRERLVVLSMYPVVVLIIHLVCDRFSPSLLDSSPVSH